MNIDKEQLSRYLQARKPSRSFPPAPPPQHISNTRVSPYRLGGPRMLCAPRVPGAPSTLEAQACQALQVRHVLHVRQVCHVLQPRQVRHVRDKVTSGCPRTSQMSSQRCVVFFLLPGTVGLLAASNMPAPPPSESKPMQSGRGAPAHAQNLEAKCILCCFCQGWLACAQQAICQYARRPCQKPMQNRARGARACSMFGGETHLVLFLRGVAGLRPASNMPAPPPSLSRAHAKWSRGACACSRFGGNVFVLVNSS